MRRVYDALVLGSGLTGLTYALAMAEHGRVCVVTKRGRSDTNTAWAQGGIAAVLSEEDSVERHVADTLAAGDGLNDEEVVRLCAEEGPARLRQLLELGVAFDTRDDGALHLTREGGHSARRVAHVKDITGLAVQQALERAVASHPNIEILEDHLAVDLITTRRPDGSRERCVGAYVLEREAGAIHTFLARVVMLATGGAGKVYLYTSNPDVATGDGIAMAWRAGCEVANLEFFQFHPTCLYHPKARTFLVTEACRGEGGILRRIDGTAFMADHHPQGDLAPRDIVARAIDSELKRTGDEHVVLDMTHLDADFLTEHFPGVDATLTSFGIDLRTEPIPVVPAAHYCCGGVVTDTDGHTNLRGLVAAGEVAHTGLHGANRLASNSLLEGLVFAHRAAAASLELLAATPEDFRPDVLDWNPGFARDPDENVLITHAWDETRRLMWGYVGIVRSNSRLVRARRRLDVLRQEVSRDYWKYVLTADLVEVRNIVTLAGLIVESAMARHESRGLHYTLDHPHRDNACRDTVLVKGVRSFEA